MTAVEPVGDAPLGVAAQALEEIHQQHGYITAVLVVETAADPAHPLHSYIYELDDQQAAYAHRLDRARTVIRAVRINREVGDQVLSLRRYRSVAVESGERAYQDLDTIKENPITRELLLREMRRDVLALRRRYQEHEAFLDGLIREVFGERSAG